jgi:pimeloyl-ACP methyl ester carboxylesterase
MENMNRVSLGEQVAEFSDRGHGEPVVLVHGGLFSEWFAPVAAVPELDDLRVIRIRRAGYVRGASPSSHLSLSDHAAHCALLLKELNIGAAHFCGHSSGALICLQLALERPDAVRGLVLLEPAPGGDLAGAMSQAALPDAIGPVVAAFESGDAASGFDLFMRAVGGEQYRQVLEAALGSDGFKEAVSGSAFFPDEIRAVLEWRLSLSDGARITQPTLLVAGSETAKLAKIPPESVDLLAASIPRAEAAVLEGASHLMPLEDPSGVGRLICAFVKTDG